MARPNDRHAAGLAAVARCVPAVQTHAACNHRLPGVRARTATRSYMATSDLRKSAASAACVRMCGRTRSNRWRSSRCSRDRVNRIVRKSRCRHPRQQDGGPRSSCSPFSSSATSPPSSPGRRIAARAHGSRSAGSCSPAAARPTPPALASRRCSGRIGRRSRLKWRGRPDIVAITRGPRSAARRDRARRRAEAAAAPCGLMRLVSPKELPRCPTPSS